MRKVAITERGDAGLDFSWLSTINNNCAEFDFAVLVTKNPNEQFQEHLLNLKIPFIVHCTITGHGGSILEPYVPAPSTTLKWYHTLVQNYGVDRIVLRVDPIFQTTKGLQKAKAIIEQAPENARIRFSFVDMYAHVQQRFASEGLPYKVNKPETEEFLAWCATANYRFESCAESIRLDTGCISQRDYTALKIPFPTFSSHSKQRPTCQCCSSKTEVLTQKKQCPHRCLYCYWH